MPAAGNLKASRSEENKDWPMETGQKKMEERRSMMNSVK